MNENLKIIVEKRDGTIIPYDLERIKKAIYKASKSCNIENDNLVQLVANEVHKEIIKLNKEKINIHKIQEIVEEKLMVTDPKIARAYIEYRHDRDLIREKNSILTKDILNLIEQNKELVNENANKDSRIIPTQRDLLAGIVAKHYAKQFILPKDVVASHEKGEIHYHDLDYSPFFPMTNCCLVDLKFMLENGFRMGNADISTPKSITTATAITSQIIASVASCQYGGTSINRIDEVLAPYVEKSYQKLLKIAEEYQIPNIKKFADERIEKEVYDAFQALEYEVNTLQTTNGQTPFITFGFGLGESWQSKLIQKAILKNRINGLGESKKTAIFPKLVFSIKEGLNKNPNDPNYDVKELALKCASLRMYPDILNYEKVIEVTGNFKAPMGCVDGEETIVYKIDENIFVESFENTWNKFSSIYPIKTHGISEYIEINNFEILDKNNIFTKVKAIIKNPDQGNWVRLKFSNGRQLLCTEDHPLKVFNKGRVFVKDMNIGDEIEAYNIIPIIKNEEYSKEEAWLNALIICDSSYEDNLRISLGMDEKDIALKAKDILMKLYPNNFIKILEQKRGIKGNYLDVIVQGEGSKSVCNKYSSLFNGELKKDRNIPNYIFNSSVDTRAAFIAGIIDADGSIKPSGVVQIGSVNKKFSLQQMELIQSLGLDAKVYLNFYEKTKQKIRYRVEFKITDNILKYVTSKKKKNKIIKIYKDKTNLNTKLTEKIYLGFLNKSSYDVTTESDTFCVSGIVSHNCRSFLSKWVDENNNEIVDGRNNLGVITINLPRIAIESKGNENKFYEILEERLLIAKEALLTRIDSLKNATASVAPILYCEGAFGVKMKPDEPILNLFKNGRASISLGYIGIYETIYALYEEDLYDYEVLQEKALNIVKKLHNACEEWKKETGYGFSLYSTPAENLCYRFCKLDRKEFGIIKNVTDKEYYTNSFHLDVRKKVSPFEKILFEKDYPQYANGGFINYVEYGQMKNNLKGLETVWDFSYDKVPYLGSNIAIDFCDKCGFQGEFLATSKGFECPKCGNHDPNTISVVRRTCGYLGDGSRNPFNHGKMEEIKKRVKHF